MRVVDFNRTCSQALATSWPIIKDVGVGILIHAAVIPLWMVVGLIAVWYITGLLSLTLTLIARLWPAGGI